MRTVIIVGRWFSIAITLNIYFLSILQLYNISLARTQPGGGKN